MSQSESPTVFSSNIEGKYTVDLGNHDFVLAALRQLCRSDPEYPGDHINSAYFDTVDLDMLRQKLDSNYLKTKLRLRWYGSPSASETPVTAYLEIKGKEGVRRRKVRKKVSLAAAAVQPGKESFTDIQQFANSAYELDWIPNAAVFPMIVIRYYRHRFSEPLSGARISLDSEIQYSNVNPHFFPATGSRKLKHCVLEIKSDAGGMPPALASIKSRVNIRDSFSKYEECWSLYGNVAYRRELTSSRYD